MQSGKICVRTLHSACWKFLFFVNLFNHFQLREQITPFGDAIVKKIILSSYSDYMATKYDFLPRDRNFKNFKNFVAKKVFFLNFEFYSKKYFLNVHVQP
jgi:hypothetical protein